MTLAEHQIQIERETNAGVIGALIARLAEARAELEAVKAELAELKAKNAAPP